MAKFAVECQNFKKGPQRTDGLASYEAAHQEFLRLNNQPGGGAYNFRILCVEPEVGMGATVCYYSDRHAATVVSVSKSKKQVEVTIDAAERTDKNGMSDCQSYKYTTRPDGQKMAFSIRPNGNWVQVGDPSKGGTKLGIGFRNAYHDYSF